MQICKCVNIKFFVVDNMLICMVIRKVRHKHNAEKKTDDSFNIELTFYYNKCNVCVITIIIINNNINVSNVCIYVTPSVNIFIYRNN